MNLSEYIRNKIDNHCFHYLNDFKVLKSYDEKIDISDLICHPIDQLMSAIDDQVEFIISDIRENRDIHYDHRMMAIIALCYKLQFLPKYKILDDYLNLVLEKEKLYKTELISNSVIYILIHYVKKNIKPIEFWKKLYNNNPKLAFISGCAILKYEFVGNLYQEILQNFDYVVVHNTILECDVLSESDLIQVNNKLPTNIKNKIIEDINKREYKNIVLN